MAKIAIMQPYIFPYVGYFQMIAAVDLFVFYDDVNFIKKGWIHRNRILMNDRDLLFTIPCENVSQNKRINETKIAPEPTEIKKLLATIEMSYKKAPYYSQVMPLVKLALANPPAYIHELAINSVKIFAEYIGLQCQFKSSSGSYDNEDLKKADRLVDICRQEKIVDYINAVGGQEIYTKEYFHDRGIKLSFIKSKPVTYKQFGDNFVPWLSIIDVAMFNDVPAIREFVTQYELI
jgi:hypothetical protein